jgi:4-aminobutyrate aminotransferase-like enzyme
VTTSSGNYRLGYEPLLPSVYFTPFPRVYADYGGDEKQATRACLEHLQRLTSATVPAKSVAAILIEPVQGEGGYHPAPASFLRALREFCDEHGILLIADEVQSGYGRTGSMWAVDHASVVPDVVCMAKAMANGLPLAALATRRELQERWGKGAHGSTYGGNPVACAAGIAVLETMRDEGLVENAAARGEELTRSLRSIAAEDERIGDVRGPGLMIGVEMVTGRDGRRPDGALAHSVMTRAAELGLLVLSCGPEHQVIRWIAPLDVTAAEIAEGVEIFGEALRGA